MIKIMMYTRHKYNQHACTPSTVDCMIASELCFPSAKVVGTFVSDLKRICLTIGAYIKDTSPKLGSR